MIAEIEVRNECANPHCGSYLTLRYVARELPLAAATIRKDMLMHAWIIRLSNEFRQLKEHLIIKTGVTGLIHLNELLSKTDFDPKQDMYYCSSKCLETHQTQLQREEQEEKDAAARSIY